MAPSLLLTNFIHSLKWQESASYLKRENTIILLTNSRGEGSFWSGVAGRWGYRGRGVEIMQPAFARTPKHSTALIRLHLYTVSTELVLGNASKVKVCNIYCTADLQRAWMEVRKRICHCLSPGGTRGHTGQDTLQFASNNMASVLCFDSPLVNIRLFICLFCL